MNTDPGAIPLTTPAFDTVASAGFNDAQVIVRPASGRPMASCAMAESVTLSPSLTEGVRWLMSTATTGTGITVTCVEPETPSAVAVMLAEPGATPVTTPDPSTVAIVVAEELHVKEAGIAAPFASFAAAEAWMVPPTSTWGASVVTVTDVTFGGAWGESPPPHAVSSPARRTAEPT